MLRSPSFHIPAYSPFMIVFHIIQYHATPTTEAVSSDNQRMDKHGLRFCVLRDYPPVLHTTTTRTTYANPAVVLRHNDGQLQSGMHNTHKYVHET
jgi:hypothetical protein